MACIMENGCDCIGVVLSGSFTVDGTDYEFFADPVYSREAGEARLNKFADDPVPAPEGGPNHTCLCGWIGFTNVREVGTTTTEPAAVRVFVHSNDILYVEVTIGNYRFSSAAERAVMWIPKYWAPGSPGCVCDGPPAVCVPPMPLAGSLAWPYTATPILIDMILTADDDINNTMDFNFSTNQDICKSRCVGTVWQDVSGNSYPFDTCGTAPNKKCPEGWTVEEWPWHREIATGATDTINNSNDGDIDLFAYYTYGFRKPYFPSKDIFNEGCSADVRDVGRGWRPNSSFSVQASKWWEVEAGGGWSTSEPTGPPDSYYWSFSHDCDTYYAAEVTSGVAPDYPFFRIRMPCGATTPPANDPTCPSFQFQTGYQLPFSYTIPAGFTFAQLRAEGGEYIYPSYSYVKINAQRKAQATTTDCIDAEGTPASHCYVIDGITLPAIAPAPTRTRHYIPPTPECDPGCHELFGPEGVESSQAAAQAAAANYIATHPDFPDEVCEYAGDVICPNNPEYWAVIVEVVPGVWHWSLHVCCTDASSCAEAGCDSLCYSTAFWGETQAEAQQLLNDYCNVDMCNSNGCYFTGTDRTCEYIIYDPPSEMWLGICCCQAPPSLCETGCSPQNLVGTGHETSPGAAVTAAKAAISANCPTAPLCTNCDDPQGVYYIDSDAFPGILWRWFAYCCCEDNI